ncbi:MAG: serine/threonine-protein kinase, partial [Kofleriaceae bacterium]
MTQSAVLLGRYQIIRRLAVGGMAEIFLARARGIAGFEKIVVVKRILPQYAKDTRFIRMFLEEARLAASLQHSNIAQVHDIGRIDDIYFFTMEYVHGVDLRQLLVQGSQRGGIPLEHAIAVMQDTAAGLHYAHEKTDDAGTPLGIVHRDISPSNVLVGYDGGVKLTDFGIAKATSARTETGTGVKGKAAYMSPEQCRGRPMDRRSDIFSLGILLFELTTGTELFAGASDMLIFEQIVEHDIPRPSSRVPGYPPALERIVMTALERDPQRRFQTAEQLQSALVDFAHHARLSVSQLALARYVEALFKSEIDTWRTAQRAGHSLAEFLGASRQPLDHAMFEGHVSVDLLRERDRTELAPDGLLATQTLDIRRDQGPGRPRPRWLVSGLVAALVIGAAALVMVVRDAGDQPSHDLAVAPLPPSFAPPAPPAVPAVTEPVASPPPERPTTGTLSVKVDVPGARVHVDGALIPASPGGALAP